MEEEVKNDQQAHDAASSGVNAMTFEAHRTEVRGMYAMGETPQNNLLGWNAESGNFKLHV